jgi:hypothetical protein
MHDEEHPAPGYGPGFPRLTPHEAGITDDPGLTWDLVDPGTPLPMDLSPYPEVAAMAPPPAAAGQAIDELLRLFPDGIGEIEPEAEP